MLLVDGELFDEHHGVKSVPRQTDRQNLNKILAAARSMNSQAFSVYTLSKRAHVDRRATTRFLDLFEELSRHGLIILELKRSFYGGPGRGHKKFFRKEFVVCELLQAKPRYVP